MTIEDLHFSYGAHEVLKGISFQVESSGFFSLLGPNGAGKSTLFRCMLGLLEPTSGSVHICGRNIRQMSPAELSHRVAYIPQSHTPVFNFSVFDMVLMGTTAQLPPFASPGKNSGSWRRRPWNAWAFPIFGTGAAAASAVENVSWP